MASLLPESYTCNINGTEDGLEGFKLSGINGALLMSFLEELQDEDRDDDERLNSVIQSLEAEINSSSTSTTMDGPDHSNMDQTQAMSDDGSCSLGHMINNRDCSVSMDEIDQIGGVDHMETVPCPPSDDMNWYMEPYGDETHSIIGFGGVVNDYSHVYNGVSLDLEDHDGYSSLWQETTNDSMMYESLPPQCTF